jgi:formylglycine-generating enzyme required for sulfatase activity
VAVPNGGALTTPGLLVARDEEQKGMLVRQILRGELSPREACERQGLSELELRQWVRDYTRLARRAVDDQLTATLAAHGLDVEELPTAEFSGSLSEIGVGELIQTIQYGKKDGLLRLEHAGELSQLWCIEGDVVDAQSARLTGAAAVYRILDIEEGWLYATFAPVERPRTIHASTQALLLEAAKRADECRDIRARLGDMLNVYVPSASAPSDSDVEPEQGEMLRAFDGERSVEQIVHDSEFPDLETLVMISRLMEQEWLVPRPFVVRKRQLAAAPPARAEQASSADIEQSFLPLAASLNYRTSIGDPRSPRQRLWASAAAGVVVVAAAFGVGFYSASEHKPFSPRLLAASARPAPRCPQAMAPLPGGQCLDRGAVTVYDYQACVRVGACSTVQGLDTSQRPAAPAAAGVALLDTSSSCNAAVPGREAQPLNCVTVQQARRFCEWRGKRLPKRAEWEQAAAASAAAPAPDLANGFSEWAVETSELAAGPAGVERERYVVLGSSEGGPAGSITRLRMNANAQGRNVGFRCASDAPPAADPPR